jgi:hypothetical protein
MNILDLPAWAFILIAVYVIWCFLTVVIYLMHLIGISLGWPCANLACKNTLYHADYTSMYCHDCRHLDVELQRDPNQRHYRTEAAYSGDWSKVR